MIPTHTATFPLSRLLAFGWLLCFFSANAATNTVRFSLGNFTTESAAYKQVRIDPLPSSFPRAEGDQVLGLDPQFFVTDGTGQFTNVMATGDYKITYTNRFKPTPFQITLPSTNYAGILNAKDLTSSGTNAPGNLAAYSQAQSDARYVLNSGGSGTNLTLSKTTLASNLFADTVKATNNVAVLDSANGVFRLVASAGDTVLKWGANDTAIPNQWTGDIEVGPSFGVAFFRVTNATGGFSAGTNSFRVDGLGRINGVKVYRALITQSGSSAPTAVVLENSLGGTVVLARTSVGIYTLTLAGAFPVDKVVPLVGGAFSVSAGVDAPIFRSTDDVVTIRTYSGGVLTDGILSVTSVQILVYP